MTRWTSPLIFMSCFYCLLPLDTLPPSTTEAHHHVGRTAVFLSCMHHYFLGLGVVFRMNFNVKCCVIAKNGKTRCYCKTLSQQCKTFEHNKMIVAKHASEKTKSILEVSLISLFLGDQPLKLWSKGNDTEMSGAQRDRQGLTDIR